MFKISVIIINYNSSEYTINCINSILSNTDKSLSFQLIIVDNASQLEDLEKLKIGLSDINFKNLIFVESKINTGFGGGNMLGVQAANGEYLAFINNDSVFENDCLTIMINEMESNSEIGICGPLCHNEKGKLLPTLDYFASPFKEIFGRKILHKLNPKKYPPRNFIPEKPVKGQFVAGSFMMVKSKDFNEIGGFDTNIFLYYEETDLCLRLLKNNKCAYLIPSAKFIHYHGVSTPKSVLIKNELKISFLYVIRKHYGYLWYIVILNKLRIQFFLKSIFKPKYWKIFFTLLKGAHLSSSLKLKQQIIS